jgi:hypothetical protein
MERLKFIFAGEKEDGGLNPEVFVPLRLRVPLSRCLGGSAFGNPKGSLGRLLAPAILFPGSPESEQPTSLDIIFALLCLRGGPPQRQHGTALRD